VATHQTSEVEAEEGRDILMFRALGTTFLLVMAASAAQAPDAVPVAREPHHHLVLENSYVRVFRVTVPEHSATLLHQHNLPYLYVALGAGDFVNAVAGKPEVHVVMTDGQVGYSPGHFAHVARVDADIPFNNVTIELLRPQGEVRNLCQKVVEGPLRDCSSDAGSLPANSPLPALARAVGQKGLFETDEILVRSFSFSLKQAYSESGTQLPRLLIVGGDSGLQLDLPGELPKNLHGGESAWIDGGKKAAILTPGPDRLTHFVMVYFR
jgi:hypothetical protein